MTSIFQHQLQPFEENQSPSPVDESANPFDLHYARSRSPPRSPPASSPPAPSPPKLSHINTLQRQLSGDPESPPPAWQRRTSFTQSASQIKRSTSQGPTSAPPVASRPVRSPSSHLPSRRHPGLMMTSTPTGSFLNDSPAHSSTSLSDPAADLGLPQPAFRRRLGSGTSSNRSSIHSNIDLSGMNSEDLWNLETDVTPDMSNPNRKAAERPLDTVRRMSRLTEARVTGTTGLPGDVIWPTAPPVMDIIIPTKSKSFTNVPSLSRKSSKLTRKASKRQQSTDGLAMSQAPVYMASKTDPNTPIIPRANSIMSSADSSETSLTNPTPLKTGLASRPPSAYYSRDFLSSLAPREGGYAIAAMMANPASVGTNSIDDKRRSADFDLPRARPASRAPMAKSAGMGRWSLDGGEHYHSRPYMTGSPATTSSNLTGAPITSPEPSPPSEDIRSPSLSYLPEGASAPAASSPIAANATTSSPLQRLEVSPPPLQASSSSPINPSPLSRSLSQTLTTSPPSNSVPTLPIPPIPASPPRVISPQKSKKDLAKEAKEAKAAEKAEAARVAKEKADKAKVEAMQTLKERQEADRLATEKKAQEKAAAVKAEAERKAKYARMKEDAKRKEKEDKEKRKAEKQAAKLQAKAASASQAPAPKKTGAFGLSAPSITHLPSAISFSRHASSTDRTATANADPAPPVPPVPSIPAELGGPRTPIPAPTATAPAAPESRPPAESAPRKISMSAPLAKLTAATSASTSTSGKKKMGFLGTIKKRFSVLDNGSVAPRGQSPAGPAPPPKSPVTPVMPKAGNSGSSADTAIPPTPKTPIPAGEPAAEEAVVIINGPPPITSSPSPSHEAFHTPTRSPALSGASHLSPPVTYSPTMETAARPPRSSSYHASPHSVRSATIPQPDEVPDATTVSPSSSVRRGNRGSVHGPRPMPPTRARSHSATSRSSHAPSAALPSPSLTAGGAAAGASGSPSQSFPFHVPSAAIPTTPGDSVLSHATPSQSSSSTTGQTASDLASPFSPDGSRKSSMTSAEADVAAYLAATAAEAGDDKEQAKQPAREGSDDTIHAHPESASLAGGPIIAAH